MPLSDTMLRLLRGLRTIILLWIGLLVFALLLNATGLRDGPGKTSFSDLRQELEVRVSTAGEDSETAPAVRFDNFLVSVYLIPLFLFRWICGIGARRGISPAAILTALLCLASVSVLLGQVVWTSGRSPEAVDPMAAMAVYGQIFVLLLALPILIRAAVSIANGLPLAFVSWLLYVPARLDRGLRHVFDIGGGRLARRFGRRTSYVSNGLLVAGLAVPSAVALWWVCDWLDGRGESLFAFAVRGAIVVMCLAMVARTHMRTYGPATSAKAA